MPIKDAIQQRLQKEFSPTFLEVIDESADHAGHAKKGQGGYFKVQIESTRFVGQSKVACHRMVYTSLNDLFAEDIHALALDCKIPSQEKE